MVNRQPSENRRMLTWYGVQATVIIGPGFVHKTGLGSFVIPHPPLASRLLRRALESGARQKLTFVHEFGHLQTAPMILMYGDAAMVIYLTNNRANLSGALITLVGAQAAWEIVSELCVVRNDPQFYRESYHEVGLLPRLIFWVLAGAFTLLGWVPAVLR